MRLRGRKDPAEELAKWRETTGRIVLAPGDWKGRWAELFGNDHPIHAELGMGKGKFIAEMALKHPDINFIGIDRYDELIRRGAEKAAAAAASLGGTWAFPANLALARMDIARIDEAFGEKEAERIYLNFSDPWPKTRHVHRRLTHPDFVRKYRVVLNDNGEIHLKTDSCALFEYSLNVFAEMDIKLRAISLDLHSGGVIRPDLVMTEYESKFVERGQPIFRCEALVGSAVEAEHAKQAARLRGSF